MTRKQNNNENQQDGGVLPKSKKPSAKERATKALTTVQSAIQKPERAESASSMILGDMSGDEDVEMQMLRRSVRSKAKPQTFVPSLIGPSKSRGPLTEEQKAARKAARAAKMAASMAPKEQVVHALPNVEAIEAARKQQAIDTLAKELLTQQMELEPKRARRTVVNKQDEERRVAAAYAEAKKQLATEKKAEKQAVASEADLLADLFGQMTTLRPVAPVAPAQQVYGMHSSGHPIVGYDPKDGWPLGVNPATGQVERFATKDGGKKKRAYKKKNQKGGEVEGAVAENVESQPEPVSGGKKKRAYKKKN